MPKCVAGWVDYTARSAMHSIGYVISLQAQTYTPHSLRFPFSCRILNLSSFVVGWEVPTGNGIQVLKEIPPVYVLKVCFFYSRARLPRRGNLVALFFLRLLVSLPVELTTTGELATYIVLAESFMPMSFRVSK